MRKNPDSAIARLPRVKLATLPTPLEPLPRLSRSLAGPQIYIKRDDLSGLAGGGNKSRKLEFLAGEALAQGCDTLVTVGSAQSNHCRQTAAAAARNGLGSILVLRGHEPPEKTGNLLLNHLLGAGIRWAGERPRERVMEEVVAAERAAGRSPYAIPLGGSTPLGALGYVLAVKELKEQADSALGGARFDRIIVAASSGGTHAGLLAGTRLYEFEVEVLGISIDEELDPLRNEVARIATGVMGLLGQADAFSPADIRANADYLGEGYGVVGEREREAIDTFARTEGILLDPVYTGRAAAGMIDLIRKGVLAGSESILFWHTGGVPALWAYTEILTQEGSGRSDESDGPGGTVPH